MTEEGPAWDSAAAESAGIEDAGKDDGALSRAGLAPDDPVLASDDERVRRVIDALLHPTPTSAAAGHPDPSGRPGTQTARRGERASVRPATDDALRPYRPADWRWLIESEHARVARYGVRSTIVQIEIVDIADIAAHLGDEAAGRLVNVLADTLHHDTRGADAYARVDRWRIVGLLAETDGAAAERPIGRIAEGFDRRLGGRLRLGLAVGRAELDPRLDPAATLAAAELSMHLQAHRLSGSRRAPDQVPAPAGAPSEGPIAAGTASPVRDSLRELGRLRAEGLIDDDEHRATRLEILRRI